MKEQHPTLSKGELNKRLAELWKNFPPERQVKQYNMKQTNINFIRIM